MQRLEIAEQQIRSYMSDRMAFRGVLPEEVVALAKLREALALIGEAKLADGRATTRKLVMSSPPSGP